MHSFCSERWKIEAISVPNNYLLNQEPPLRFWLQCWTMGISLLYVMWDSSSREMIYLSLYSLFWLSLVCGASLFIASSTSNQYNFIFHYPKSHHLAKPSSAIFDSLWVFQNLQSKRTLWCVCVFDIRAIICVVRKVH